MAETDTLGKPLLEGNDVEQGRTEPTAEENAELLEEGQMSWKELMEFFANPTHWIVTALVVYTIICVLGMCYYFVTIGNFDLSHNVGEIAFLGVVGLAGSAYNSFLAEQLKEEVNRYWKLNQQLKSNRARLEKTCQNLRVNVQNMQDEVKSFQTLKDQMQQFADQLGGGFTEMINRAMGVLDNMKSELSSSQSNLLTNYAMRMEFLDGEEGMTAEEFTSFRARLPADYQKVDFDEISEGNSTASCEQVQALIDRVTSSLKQ